MQHKLEDLKGTKNHIVINIDEQTTQHLYYEDSTSLKQISYFPYIQLGVMILFVAIVYFAVVSTKKAEQNKVWVGLSKETAHQLGTPISSLMAWVQMLEATGVDKEIVDDMDKDVHRLSVIADRFRNRFEARNGTGVYLRVRNERFGIYACPHFFERGIEHLSA